MEIVLILFFCDFSLQVVFLLKIKLKNLCASVSWFLLELIMLYMHVSIFFFFWYVRIGWPGGGVLGVLGLG